MSRFTFGILSIVVLGLLFGHFFGELDVPSFFWGVVACCISGWMNIKEESK
ncbi:hypothetical protein [Bacillus cereus]|uniref:hypothetical protein n=1 Tax=Bacillus cereus TaxID=1396 RepID=UPI001596BDF2|nr:hypothetical protein [Bacillus cereus]